MWNARGMEARKKGFRITISWNIGKTGGNFFIILHNVYLLLSTGITENLLTDQYRKIKSDLEVRRVQMNMDFIQEYKIPNWAVS
jgi:hypothetical protein